MGSRVMKTYILLGCLLITGTLFAQKEYTYDLQFQVKGLENDTVYLANYLGKKLYYYDTTYTNASGAFAFQGDDSIPGGMYAVVIPGQQYFEVLINEQKFSMSTSMQNMVEDMKIKGSKENKIFFDYMKFISDQKKKSKQLQGQLKGAEGKKKKKVKKQLNELNEKVKAYQEKLAKDHSDLLVGKFINMSREIDVPDAPKNEEGEKEKNFAYRYYKNHYWDNTDLSDPRLVRTPIFDNKMKKYFKKVTVQHPDSITKAADEVIGQIPKGTEMFKYVVHWVTNQYERSKIMGMDEVFVHMAENYYNTGDAFWMDSTNLANLKDRASKLKPLLIGKKAPNLILADTNGDFHDLYKTGAKYTVLYFWDPDCGHCKKATPKLKEVYDDLKEDNVEVYAVGTPLKTKKWQKYIRENDLNWINVSDSPDMNENPRKYLDRTTIQSLNFRDIYDIYSTPKVFVLDENSEIIVKGVGIEQLEEILLEKLGKKKASDDKIIKKDIEEQRPNSSQRK